MPRRITVRCLHVDANMWQPMTFACSLGREIYTAIGIDITYPQFIYVPADDAWAAHTYHPHPIVLTDHTVVNFELTQCGSFTTAWQKLETSQYQLVVARIFDQRIDVPGGDCTQWRGYTTMAALPPQTQKLLYYGSPATANCPDHGAYRDALGGTFVSEYPITKDSIDRFRHIIKVLFTRALAQLPRQSAHPVSLS